MDLKECLLVCCICVLILAQFSLSEIFELSSPPTVIGHVGQDVVLPCEISLGTQPQNMEVQWKKIGDNHDDDIYQFIAATGQETFGPSYLGRAAVATKEDEATGNVSLKLKKVQVSDRGIYRCIVQSKNAVVETETVLLTAALGNMSIEILGPEGEGIKLACKSDGSYPKPELHWLAKGNIFPHFSMWLLAFWILFVLTLLVVGVAVYYRYKGKQKMKRNEEEQRIILGDQKELLQKCDEEMTRMHQENQDLKETLGKLEETLRKCKEEKERQHQENQNLNRKLEQLKESLKECSEENERLHQGRPSEDQSGK